MPLQGEREGGRIGHAEGLDLAVIGDRFEARARRQLINALGVQRIDRDPTRAQQAMQHAAFDDIDIVRRRIILVGGRSLGRAMVAPAVDLVHQLMQGATQRDRCCA